MSNTPHIDPRSDGIGHAIADKKPAVPIRQRHYSWDRDLVNQLFEDLENAINDGDEDYFLGLVVVATGSGGRPEVVDGQQRLATSVILIAAIRDYLLQHTSDKDTAEAYERTYLIDFDPRAKEHVPRLKLNQDDADFFTDYVLRSPADTKRIAAQKVKKLRESNKNIKVAAEVARERVETIVKGVAKERHADRLTTWVDYLHDKARIIWFAVPDREHAYRIFETLNDRGLELSKSDLLKNHLFEVAGDDWEDAHQQWSKMMGILEAVARTEPPATYIRHFWIAQNGPTRERELFKSIKAVVNKKSRALAFAKELAEQANLYAALLNSDHEHWRPLGTTARKDVSTLVMLKAERIRPLVLATARHFDPPELKKALRLFVACSVRFIIAGGVAGTIERMFGMLAKEVTDGNITTAKELAKKLSEFTPSDKDFEVAFAVARVTKGPLARYYLRVLETVRRGDEDDSALAVDENEEKTNIEHIMPANPSLAWKLDDAEGQRTVNDYVNRLGNMTLLRRRLNEVAANAAITEKAAIYASEKGLYLTSELGKLKTWTPEDIEERQRKLAEYAVKGWPLKA